ncbi:hypothetical protein FRC09_009236 [Ceratobasidium sp. 395]|nr:hypothetical protein FRC09_009236 [Ceratobasidium sp. 395]
MKKKKCNNQTKLESELVIRDPHFPDGKGGDGDNEAKPESDFEIDANGDVAAEPRDNKMVLLEADTSDKETNVGDKLGNKHEPSKTLKHPFFTADSGLAPGGSNSSNDDNVSRPILGLCTKGRE